MLPFRVACVVYGVLLTFLLLAQDPLALLGIPRPPGPPGGRGVHFLLFTLLAFLVLASRWPVRLPLLAGLLAAYAFLTELLQSLIPNRTVELLDLMENLSGLATGGAIWWFVRQKLAGPGRKLSRTTANRRTPSPNWEDGGAAGESASRHDH